MQRARFAIRVGAAETRAPRLSLLLLGAVALALAALPLPGAAQDSAAGPGSAEPTENPALPLLVMVLQQPMDKPLRRDDPNALLLPRLREAIRASGKFRVTTYSPKSPVIRRALLERALNASDLIEPMKPDALQRLAHFLNAKYILSFVASSSREGIQAEALLQENLNQRDWRILLNEQIKAPAAIGRKRLKREEMSDLIVDAIATRMAIPSPLAKNAPRLQDLEKQAAKPEPGANASGKTDVPRNVGKPEKAASRRPKPEKQAKKPGKPQNETPPQENGAQNPPEKQAARPGEKNSAEAQQPEQAANPGRAGNSPEVGPNAPGNAERLPALVGDPNRGRVEPAAPPSAPPPTTARVDNESLALRFRQQGDLANVITSLRRAVNERPREMGLRRLLILAYVDRKLFDEAYGETERALLLAPNDSGLRRAQGDVLMAKNDVAGALKQYREAVKLDPNDISAQVALGDALLADNLYAEAMVAYETAARTDAKSPLPHRRMARALAGSAASDPARYAESLARVQQARALTPPTDAASYLEDYIGIMSTMETRLRDALEELQNNYQAALLGKKLVPELKTAAADMRKRAEAAADYLDRLPAAVGQEVTHAHYQQGAAFLLQALSLFDAYLMKNETHTEEAMNGARADARREIQAGSKRLNALKPKPVAEPLR